MSTETEADTSTLEALDFEVRCEAPGHDTPQMPDGRTGHVGGSPAVWLERNFCPGCSSQIARLSCEPRRLVIARNPLVFHTSGCGYGGPATEFSFTYTPLPGVTS